LGREVTVRKAVDAAEMRIADTFRDRPLVEASLRDTLSLTYWYLGEPALAVPQAERAYEIRSAKLGPDHPDALTTLDNLATAYRSAGDTARAIARYEDCLKRRAAKLGPDHPNTLTCMLNLASVYRATGQTTDSLPLFEKELRGYQDRNGLCPSSCAH
jgi:tetratricopeptide (TPR) repeat protein